MEYITEITLNLEPGGAIPVVTVKQGDAASRFILATLIDHETRVVPGSGMTAVFREERPDGTVVTFDSTTADPDSNRHFVIINGDGSITVEITGQATACDGRCMCDLCLEENGKTVSTAVFVLNVVRSPNVDRLSHS